ncbi:hypothetical protein [Thermococcus sibiricus]|uniref:Permease n=1 Tax=Thermococcus sibiricus (strain DSM 12597 / MM 739) TaxID=604354 RepID=C6A4E6_THESM|nr:hypothetical protein [Thermococcus sibiricus]ACS90491.1 hypothetical protein TSIB_1440 [Thermococcus sibiricus MM 739]
MIRILYRELHYQIAKRNPLVVNDEKQFKKAIKNAMSLKRGLGVQTFGFIPFGLLMASTFVFTNDRLVLASLMVSLALLPFVFAMYVTAIQASYVLSIGLFKPLEALPIRLGSKYLSGLLFLEISPALGVILPSVFVIMAKYPLEGTLALLWVFIGLFLGHALGLVIVNFFALKVHQRAGKGHTLKSLVKAVFFLLFIGMFMAMNYLQYYIREHSEEVARIIGKYFIAYPFSVASIFEPSRSAGLLMVYVAIIAPVYYLTLRAVWKKILEPPVVSEKIFVSKFKAKITNKLLALTLKDFRMFVRKPAMLVAFLIPLYMVLPTIVDAFRKGQLSLLNVLVVLFMIGLFSVAGADAVLKVEGNVLELLKTLPIRKREFMLSKILSMTIVPITIGVLIVIFGARYDVDSLLLLPYAFMLPLISASITMLYLFRYTGEDIGIPELSWLYMIFMIIIVGIVFALIAAPLVFGLKHLFVSQGIALGILFILFIMAKKH